MALFHYKALSEQGRGLSGIIDADSYEMAKERLVKQKLLITKLIAAEKRGRRLQLNDALLLAFTRDLSQLLSAGLPLYESLLTIEEKFRKLPAHGLFLDLCDRLKAGELLSHILKDYPKTFDPIYLAMVRASEKTGSLAAVFGQLYDLIDRKQALKRKIKSAAAYPLFLAGFAFCVMMAILIFVIPSMRELFEGRQLHMLTTMMLNLSDFIRMHYGLLAAALAAIALFGWIGWIKKRNWIQNFLLKIPLLKTIITESAIVRFSRSLFLLLNGGMPLAQALNYARATLQHAELDLAFAISAEKLTEGKSLSEGLKQAEGVPSLILRMVLLAEDTGKMADAFEHLSEFYHQELERHLLQVTTFLQPVLLLILGALVGIMILSILIPLTDFSSFIST